VDRPAGCAFAPRCDRVRAACSAQVHLRRRGQESGHLDACVAGEQP
jgi:peptide/nickel transport system ATP-binding protein